MSHVTLVMQSVGPFLIVLCFEKFANCIGQWGYLDWKKVKKIFSSMVCCTGWTEYVFLVWHIVVLTGTKVLSYYPKWKASQDGKNIFFPLKRVPAQLASYFLVYLNCFPGGLSLLKHDANIVVFPFGPVHETKTLYSSTMFLSTSHWHFCPWFCLY